MASNSKGDVRLTFSSPNPKGELRGYADKDAFKGKADLERLNSLVGKEIIIEGKFMQRPNWGNHGKMVQFFSNDQVRLASDQL